MPDRNLYGSSGPRSGGERSERLNRAIDRLLDGQPAPMLDDPDLRDLLQLAGRLRNDLPSDLPDPHFRAALKSQLTGAPRTIISKRGPRSVVTRFPYAAVVGAIAAVLAVAIGVGSLGVWMDDGVGSPEPAMEIVRSSTGPVTMSSLAVATMTVADSPALMDVVTPAASEVQRAPTLAATVLATEILEPSTAMQVTPDPPAPATATVVPAGEPTAAVRIASVAVPPVDAQHLAMGPGTAAGGGGGQSADGVDYVLDTDLPDLDQSAPVYRLAPPSVDPAEFVTAIAGALGMEGDVESGESAFGGTDYYLYGENGEALYWTPDTGAFSYVAAPRETDATVGETQVSQRVVEWLIGIGYPIDPTTIDVSVEPFGEGVWLVQVIHGNVPQPGIGHPVGITMFVTDDGKITEARGYWLEMVEWQDAPLSTAEELWSKIEQGAGYWTGGGIVEGPGEFHTDGVRLSYVMTADDDGTLVLQPVMRADGEFRASDGLSSRVSVFVQAVRTADP